MLDFSTAKDTVKYLVQTYGPLFPATATTVAAIIAAFAARAAMRSARASEENVETGKRSMELANRAYVCVTATKFIEKVSPGVLPNAGVTFKNIGKTPAKMCRLKLEVGYVSPQFGRVIPEEPLDEGEFTLAPSQQQTVFILADEPLDRQRLVELHTEVLFLDFWGRIVYQDIFGKEHETTWCSTYSANSPTKMALHKYGNNMT